MWSLVKSVGVALRLINNDASNDLEKDEESKILEILDANDSVDEDDNYMSNDEHNKVVSDLCNHKVGMVSHFSDDGNGGMIDGFYYFKLVDAPSDIRVGDRVRFIAYRKNENSAWIVKNIYAVSNEMWDEGNEIDVAENGEIESQRIDVSETSMVGKIVKRDGRQLFIQPGNSSCHLDKISTSFIPIEGDWVLLKSLVEVDNVNNVNQGRILQVDSLSPLRSLEDQGNVSHWEPSIRQGIIDSKVLFTMDTCDHGFLPVVGDKVWFNAIESEQGALVWRALKVMPCLKEKNDINQNKYKTNQNNHEIPSTPELDGRRKSKLFADVVEEADLAEASSDLLNDKLGITITENCNFYDIDIDSEKEVVIVVKNDSNKKHLLLSASFKSARSLMQSQIKLITPVIKANNSYGSKPFFIHAWSSVRFVFRITPRFVGKSSELFVWKFKEFEIGRRINISIVSKLVSDIEEGRRKKFSREKSHIDSQMILATKSGFVVSSEKKFRAAAFIPVKMGHFPVPKRLLDAVLGSKDDESRWVKMIDRIEEVAPSLRETLNKNNYKQRFHALLYIEEIYASVNLRTYDMPRAHFRRHLDYLILEVPGLAERRPSLICGDSVIVSNPCTVTDEKDVKYEGSIHQISKNEIWLKFNKSFHDSYNGADYMVAFSLSRTSFRRFHQAVNVTYDHLSLDWLFPSNLRQSKIQVIIDEEEDDGEAAIENCNQIENIDKRFTDSDDTGHKTCRTENFSNEISVIDNNSYTGFTIISDEISNGCNKNVNVINGSCLNSDSSVSKTDSLVCTDFLGSNEIKSNSVNSDTNLSFANKTRDLSLNLNSLGNKPSSGFVSNAPDQINSPDLSISELNESTSDSSGKAVVTPRLSVAERLKIALETKNNKSLKSCDDKQVAGTSQKVGIENNKTNTNEPEKMNISPTSSNDKASFESMPSNDLSISSSEQSHNESNSSPVTLKTTDVSDSSILNKFLTNESVNLNKLFNSSCNNVDNFNKLSTSSNDNLKLQMKTLKEIENTLLNSSINNSDKIIVNSNLDSLEPCDNNLSLSKSEGIASGKFKTVNEIEKCLLNNNRVNNDDNNVENVIDKCEVDHLSGSVGRCDENSNKEKSIKPKNVSNQSKSCTSNVDSEGGMFKNEKVSDDIRKNDDKDNYSKVHPVGKDVKINWQQTGRNWNYGLPQSKCKIRDVPNSYKRKLKWFNQKLNYCQKEAVKNILKGEARPLPYIIFGPPGTGKTITLVEAALQLLVLIPESRLLISAPSNSAANLIAERMLDSNLDLSGVLVRLCSHYYLNQDNINISERLLPYCTTAEVKVIEDELLPFAAEKRDMSGSSREILGRHRVTVGTCVSLGILYSMGFPQGHFTHILVDEAGQAMEPEILIPLAFMDEKYGQAILAGDPMQLGPVVQSNIAIQYGLRESLLSRFLNNFPYIRDVQSFPNTFGFDPRIVTRLVDNYRSLPEMLELPSTMFYESTLVSQIKEVGTKEARILLKLKEHLPMRDSDDGDVTARKLPPALVFHGVRGVNFQEEDSPSWFNPQEIVQVIFYVNIFYKVGLTPDQIGIVTPYQKQVTKIRSCLTKLEMPIPKVGTVEEFQGQERMAIILSAVRSNSKFIIHDTKHQLGFVSSPQRLNVALTRARAVLVVLGNPHLLNCDPYWRTVLKYCIQNKAYCGCDLPSEFES